MTSSSSAPVPAGLAAAIRLKQLDETSPVVVVEKGAEVGAHILSGAVIDPIGLDKLLPDWRQDEARPLTTEVSEDVFYFLTEPNGIRLPNFGMPKLMNNHGNFVGSLGLVAAISRPAEALGVEIYPGFAAAELLFNENGAVTGIATGDMGIAKDGTRLRALHPRHGIARPLHAAGRGRARLALQARSANSASKEGREPQKYGIGLKEIWQVKPEKFHKGRVQHSFGWPLDNGTGGGSFLYHFDDNLVTVGFVCTQLQEPDALALRRVPALQDPSADPRHFEGAKRLSYGSRAITEGGWQSVPKLTFPGGALIGCAAGFVNVPRIKGSHNAMLSGMLAAEHLVPALAAGRAHDEVVEIEAGWRDSRHRQGSEAGAQRQAALVEIRHLVGIALGGVDMWLNQLFGWSPFGTLKHGKPDYATLKPPARSSRSSIPSPMACSPSTSCHRSSCPRPITRKTSRHI
jgi:electron-transferring-flavoprotein dehydrogenase